MTICKDRGICRSYGAIVKNGNAILQRCRAYGAETGTLGAARNYFTFSTTSISMGIFVWEQVRGRIGREEIAASQQNLDGLDLFHSM